MNFTRIPRIEKLVFNASPRGATSDRKKLVPAYALLYLITGEFPEPIFARKPVLEQDIKKGQCTGIKVQLFGDKIQDFLYKYCIFCLAKESDFTGLPSRALDKNGNYKLFVTNPTTFPEVEKNFDALEHVGGFSVNVVTSRFCRKYHVACDPTKLPQVSYYWLLRHGLSRKRIESIIRRRDTSVEI